MTSQSQEVGDLEIIVSHGPDKHCVSLPGAATVGDLSLKLEELTAVPVGGQKIINRGKTLMNHDLNVTEAGIRNGSKLMLIGKKFNPEEDENYKQIVEAKKKIDSLAKKQSGISEELSGVEKGYLHKELESNSLSSLGKRLAACHEEYVRLLEKLDALDLGVCNQSIRMKRRSVIKEIQSQLDTNDSISTTIDKLQNTSDS
ncbi:BAG family molecular chaperone regulator 1 isoform X1 [Strongylocentrotus purpuratus]|uniref:BAG family molecular chaperone regulator 1 n=1 Tax=Strongylocentrotus purpuratus TaxID=7668 RepID=A0A7M7RAV5_STRPU|nr:BAG family molecular chaperone regulator 1 isoform X1 [Strongylocentrotus purpuratus]|eukprot:XP_784685.2 PREDICTED: BAG family molecular chaperone regulator 1 [Strongylocentrotus purpuratus]